MLRLAGSRGTESRDDVAVVPGGSGKLVVKVDMLVEGTDMPPTMTYRQAARKAVAACVSDFAAKGVRPRTFLVSLGLKKGTTEAQVRQLGNGLRDAEKEWGLGLIGGDTNESKELTIDCAMLGFGKRVVRRKGASPGDLLVVTGRFGLQPSGLRILTKGARADRAFRARATESVLRPTPHLAGGLALSTYLTSSMDSSDGLARSLHTLAGTSGVGFEVDCLPLARGVASFAGKNHLSTEDLALAGGEEYVIVGTIRGSNASEAIEVVRKAGTELLVIGRATARKGVVVLRSKGTKKPIPDEGWTHLA